ncbi:hypothetical protein TSAR_017015 [Trichomalopsis sarcophagae]|uniref:Uncharacterized protein n=1 Tax=Trichomalopsis sarcophagae TaxID=543379 RepID=A0A232EY67_9HYME|nr:hypothetical protein TSAR_017015 [Trichomalopsis sarcophagae]
MIVIIALSKYRFCGSVRLPIILSSVISHATTILRLHNVVVSKEEIYIPRADLLIDRISPYSWRTDATLQFDYTFRTAIPRWSQLDLFGRYGQRFVEFKQVETMNNRDGKSIDTDPYERR